MEETKVITNPVKVIRAYCLGCCYGSAEEVKQCPITNCELYPFRFGKNPYRKVVKDSEEKRLSKAQSLERARAKKAVLRSERKAQCDHTVDFITGE